MIKTLNLIRLMIQHTKKITSNNVKDSETEKTNKMVEFVNSMRNKENFVDICNKETNLLYKCIFCKKYLTSQQWSRLLEKHIKKTFSLNKAIDNISGDGLSKNNKKIEIKISLQDKNGQFNFVQIRPDHNIDYYILLCYNLFETKFGKIYWFLCPSKDLYELLPKYGDYAHGTKTRLGEIKDDNIHGHNHEYVLRPNPLIKKSKSKQLWDVLIEKFSNTEEGILSKLS